MSDAVLASVPGGVPLGAKLTDDLGVVA